MVEIPFKHSGIPYEMRMFVCRVLCKGKLLVSHAMRLYVSFIDNIKSITVAQRVPQRVIRIMACTNCVDIELLHDEDIIYHILLGNDISLVRIDFMPVGTLDKHRLSVYKKLPSFNLHISETYLYGSSFSPAFLVI